MRNNKKVLAGFLAASTAIVFSGCDNIAVSIDQPLNNMMMSFWFTQTYNDDVFIDNTAVLSMTAWPFRWLDYDDESQDKVYVSFDSEKRLLIQEDGLPLEVRQQPEYMSAEALEGILTFTDVQPTADTIVSFNFERNGENVVVNANLPLPKMHVFLTPATGTVYTATDEITVVWEEVSFHIPKFITTCNVTVGDSNWDLTLKQYGLTSDVESTSIMPVSTILDAFSNEYEGLIITGDSCDVSIELEMGENASTNSDLGIRSMDYVIMTVNTRSVSISL